MAELARMIGAGFFLLSATIFQDIVIFGPITLSSRGIGSLDRYAAPLSLISGLIALLVSCYFYRVFMRALRTAHPLLRGRNLWACLGILMATEVFFLFWGRILYRLPIVADIYSWLDNVI